MLPLCYAAPHLTNVILPDLLMSLDIQMSKRRKDQAEQLTHVGEKVEGVLDHDGVTAGRDAVLQLLNHVLLTQIGSAENV